MKVKGVGRDVGNSKSLFLYLDGPPNDDDIRSIHDYLRSWRREKKIDPGDLSTPYKPQLVYYLDADRYEFVQSDAATVYVKVATGIDYIYDNEQDHVIGFAIDGHIVRRLKEKLS